MNRIRDISGGILFFSLAIWAAWDLFAYSAGGGDSTMSGVIGDWLGTGRPEVCALCFALGLITSHLIGWSRRSP